MSLKANDLRVGNYVKGIGYNISWLVEGIESEYIYSSKAWRLLSSFEGIPINKEWLIKVGFKKVSDRIYVKDYHYGYEFGITNHFVIKNGDHFIRYNHIQYAHQLENLYFALTGQELTYNC